MNDKELEELKERIEDYRDVIVYSTDITQRLGIDELLLLLAECIGDKKIEEEVEKYVDDYNKSWEQTHQEFIDLHKAIGELVNWYNKNMTQEL